MRPRARTIARPRTTRLSRGAFDHTAPRRAAPPAPHSHHLAPPTRPPETYFANEQCADATVVGGVTLNHLSWARALGVPTGLLAFQGADANGDLVRTTMAELGVSAEFVRVSPAYATSVSHILSGPDGERTILMAPASTSRLTGDVMRREFGAAVAARAAMVTTEVSQLVSCCAAGGTGGT